MLTHHPKLQILLNTEEPPFYCYDLAWYKKRIEDTRRALPVFQKIFFAVMANFNRDILSTVRGSGIGLFTHAKPNISIAQNAGFQANQIVCAGSNHSQEEANWIEKTGVFYFANSVAQLRQYLRCSRQRTPAVGLRINLGEFVKKFNIQNPKHSMQDPAPRLGLLRSEIGNLNLKERSAVRGLHVYLGTSLGNDKMFVYAEAIAYLMQYIVPQLPNCRVLDLGGGFGVSYGNGADFSLSSLNSSIGELIGSQKYRPMELWCEPGRYLSAGGGVFVVRVTDVVSREIDGKKLRLIGVNASMSNFPRTFFHNASGMPVSVLGRESEPAYSERALICGASTYSSDFLSGIVDLPMVSVGDILVFSQAGAYQCSSATRFLAVNYPAEYVIEAGHVRLSQPSLPPVQHAEGNARSQRTGIHY